MKCTRETDCSVVSVIWVTFWFSLRFFYSPWETSPCSPCSIDCRYSLCPRSPRYQHSHLENRSRPCYSMNPHRTGRNFLSTLEFWTSVVSGCRLSIRMVFPDGKHFPVEEHPCPLSKSIAPNEFVRSIQHAHSLRKTVPGLLCLKHFYLPTNLTASTVPLTFSFLSQ